MMTADRHEQDENECVCEQQEEEQGLGAEIRQIGVTLYIHV